MEKPSMSMEIISDEEFYKMKEEEEKKKFLDSLLSASKNTTKNMGFSVKSMKGKSSKNIEQQTKSTSKGGLLDGTSAVFHKSEYREGVFDDAKWSSLLDQMDEMGINRSPIDDITNDEIKNFAKRVLGKLEEDAQEEDPSTKYSKMFKKEIAMYAEILKEVNIQTRFVADRLKAMGAQKKGQNGVSKFYSDMLEQFNSLSNTKMNAVKYMAELKAKAEDFRLKQVKAEGEQELGTDELVNQYYNSIMNGGRADYMARSFLSQSPIEEDQTTYKEIVDGTYEMPEGKRIPKAAWNLTQPIPEDLVNYDDSPEISSADAYGYIRNEYRKPEICIQRFADDRLAFIAIGEDGLEVEDCELPGDDLLETIDVKPMSNFAYDKYGRKYSIIDIDTSGADLSDLDDDNYQYGDDEENND